MSKHFNFSGIVDDTEETTTSKFDFSGIIDDAVESQATPVAVENTAASVAPVADLPVDLNEGPPESSFGDFIDRVEGKGDVGSLKDGRWFPYNDAAGLPTIGRGHLIKEGEDFSKGITEEESIALRDTDVEAHATRASGFIDKRFGKDTWSGLDQDQKDMLTDIEYNGGVATFRNFSKAVIKKDWDTAKEEYKRYLFRENPEGKTLRSGKQYDKLELRDRNEQFFSRFLENKPGKKDVGRVVNLATDEIRVAGYQSEKPPAALPDTGWNKEQSDARILEAQARILGPEAVAKYMTSGKLNLAGLETTIESQTTKAVLAGVFDGMSGIYDGIKQWAGIDEEGMKADKKAMDILYNSEAVGTAATIGMVAGAIAEPVGAVLPGIKAAKVVNGVRKVFSKANIARGAAIGGTVGALEYTKETKGESFIESKLKQVATYTALGGGVGALFGGAAGEGIRKIVGGKKASNNLAPTDAPLAVKREIVAAGSRTKDRLAERKAAKLIEKETGEKPVSPFIKNKMKKDLVSKEKVKLDNDDIRIESEKLVDDIDLFIASKVREGRASDKNQLAQEIREEFGDLGDDALFDATKITGRTPNLKMSPMEAEDMINWSTKTARLSDVKIGDAMQGVDSVMGSISTRIANKSEKVAVRVQKMYNDNNVMEVRSLDQVAPFMNDAKKIFGKKGSEGYDEFSSKIMSQDFDGVRNMLRTKGISEDSVQYKAFAEVESFLAKKADELVKNGLISKKSVREGYFPRVMKDLEGYKEAVGSKISSGIDKALAKAEKTILNKYKRRLTQEERAAVINNSVIKFQGSGVKTKGGVYSKQRVLDVVPENLVKYYEDPVDSLNAYIRNTTQDIGKAKFLGKSEKTFKKSGAGDTGQATDLSDIGAMLEKDLSEGTISSSDIDEVAGLVNVLLGATKDSPNKIIGGVKNIIYTSLLANPLSTATQLGDVAISMYVNGVMNTIESIAPALKKTVFAKPGAINGIVKEMGLIGHSTEEVISGGWTGKVLDKSMAYSGFTRVDALGKETAIRASMLKVTKQVRSGSKGMSEFIAKNKGKYGDEVYQMANDFKAGKVTDSTKFYAFVELSRMQPISKAELPEQYAKNPNGRILYMLKSFMLKQMDLMRNTVVQKFADGKYKEGSKNLIGISMTLGIGGASGAAVQQFLKGNPEGALEEFEPANLAENVAKAMGANKFIRDKVASGNIGSAVVDAVAPPAKVFDRMAGFDDAAITAIPIFGKLYNFWVGDGLKKEKARKDKAKRKTLRKRKGSKRRRATYGGGY